MSEKTYQITESELLALLEKQRINCAVHAKPTDEPNVIHAGSILSAPTPDLSNLKEVEQVVGGIRWVKASERLPEKFKDVIVRNTYNGRIGVGKNMFTNGLISCSFVGWNDPYQDVKVEFIEWLEEYTAPVSVVGGIDWEAEEIQSELREIILAEIYRELEPLLIGEVAYTHVIHRGKSELLAEIIRKELSAWLKTNLPKYYTAPVNTKK